MHDNGENRMKWYGMNVLSSRLFDNLEQGKDLGLGKIILEIIWLITKFMLLFAILITIFPMLLVVIILVALEKPLCFALTQSANLIQLLYGATQKTMGSSSSISKRIPTRWDSGTLLSRRE